MTVNSRVITRSTTVISGRFLRRRQQGAVDSRLGERFLGVGECICIGIHTNTKGLSDSEQLLPISVTKSSSTPTRTVRSMNRQ
ncbi:hypothetical protein D8S78_06670 [Natrialba swarupiae]|nr:hypothetical protein [Natrialba swarupiae]